MFPNVGETCWIMWTERIPFLQVVFIFAGLQIPPSSDLNKRHRGGQCPLVSAGLLA